jgi:hypothetical protein
LPAIRVKGRIGRESVRVPQILTTASQAFARAGRQLACTFDTLMARIPQKWIPVLRKNARDLGVRDFEFVDLEAKERAFLQ